MTVPDGITIRPAVSEDIALVSSLLMAEETALRGESQWTVGSLGDWWRLVSHEQDSWLAVDGDALAGMGVLMARGGIVDSWVAVHPDHRDSDLRTWLLERVEERARELGASKLLHGAYAEDEDAPPLLEPRGYLPARHYYTMVIELDGPPPEPQWPDGLTVSTFELEDARAYHDALTETFEEEWHFVAMEFEEWKRHRIEQPDFDPTLWFLVRDGAEVAAVIRCDAERFGGGWVGALGVRKPWRRRGLGEALLLHSFGEFHRRGQPQVSLGVDAQNPTGATRLYERVGMRVKSEDVVYERELG